METVDGVEYAVVSSLTNETFTIVSSTDKNEEIAEHWGSGAINEMSARLIMDSADMTIEELDDEINREEFAAVIVKSLGLNDEPGESSFTDVATVEFIGYIETAVDYGILTGYEDGTFKPGNNLSREEAMTVINRVVAIIGMEVTLEEGEADYILSAYADSNEIADYARESVAASIKLGLVSGRADGTLDPAGTITMAEVATIVQRLLEKAELI